MTIKHKDVSALCKEFKRETNDDHLQQIAQSNKAVRLFSKYVIDNKEEFKKDGKFFRQMVRAYLNILLYTCSEKPTLKSVLKNKLCLDEKLMNEMMWLSKIGRYDGITRRLGKKYSKNTRGVFLDVIEAFYAYKGTDMELYKKLENCASSKSGLGPAILTGLASALHPKKFMVYNRRSVNILYKYDDFAYLANRNMTKYPEFNDLYRTIGKDTGKSLSELDTILNRWLLASYDN